MNNNIHVNGAFLPPDKERHRLCTNQTIKYCVVMKLIFTLLIINLHVAAAAYSQRVNLNVKNQPFRSVMTKIRQQTGYYFMFPTPMLKQAKPITLTLKNATIEETLQKICEDQPFTFTIKDKAILLKTKVSETLPRSVEEKNTDIKGKITDTEGQPLAGATVVVVGYSHLGTTTNEHGEFLLNNVPESGRLMVRMIGYGTKEISYSSTNIPRILLNQIDTDMDEIQVIGYGKVSRRLNTGNVVSVGASEIERQNVTNPILALQGRVAGVEINQANGIPGSAVKINVRGINTLNQGTDPLFVIDGVPFNSNLFNTPGYGGLNTISGGTGQNIGVNPLSLINPSDIESIDVLKDADATAIYGSRGSNGVILITTKTGKAGATKLDVNVQSGIAQVSRRAKLLGTEQYLEMRKEAFKNDGVTPTITNARDLLSYDQNSYTDWQDVMIGKNAPFTNAQASISGGSNTIQYLLGSNYHRESTVFPGDWMDEKISVHFNVNSLSSNQKFKINFSGNYLDDNNKLPTADFTQYIAIAPNAPSLYLPDGTLDWTNFSNNPFKDLLIKYHSRSRNLVGNTVLAYQILPGLELKSSFGYNNVLLNERKEFPISSNNPSRGITTGTASFNTNELKTWIAEPQLNYNFQISKGKFGILVGGTLQNRKINGQIIDGEGYTDDGMLGTMAGASASSKGQTIFEEYKYSSLLGRINYNWDNRYLINLTGRRDGSSRFGPGRQFGNFGAVGLGWIFSNEHFIKQALKFISYGKIRASYGTTGNEPATNYAFIELYDLNPDLPYGGGKGIFPINLPDADYRWEVNRKAEIGLELGIFQDRIVSSVSFYRNRSSNQLVNRPLVASSGFTGIISNFPATIQNQGWEFTASSNNIKSKDFSWNTSFNLSIARNKLLSFQNEEYFGNFSIGDPINALHQYMSAGVDPTTGLYQFYDHEGKTTSTPSGDDRTHLVDVNPKYYGGLQNTFGYKNFSLEINCQFVKQQGRNYLFSSSLPPGWFQRSTGRGNQPEFVMDRTIPNEQSSKFQKFTQTIDGLNSYQFAQDSDLAYTDASYIRVKNVSLYYLLPYSLLQKLSVKNLRVSLQAQNLFTITGYKGADPEVQNVFALPALRVITAGIQLTL